MNPRRPMMNLVLSTLLSFLHLSVAITTPEGRCPHLCTCSIDNNGIERVEQITCFISDLEDFDPRSLFQFRSPFSLKLFCNSDVPRDLDSNVFAGLDNAVAVSTHNCKIGHIYANAFSGIHKIRHLTIASASNYQLTIHPDAFKSLKMIEHISLTENELDEIPNLCEIKSLKYVNVSGNALSSIKRAGLSCDNTTTIDKLKVIDISKNEFKSVLELEHYGSSFPGLESFYAADNEICFQRRDEVPFKHWPALRILELSRNNISEIQVGLLTNNLRLEDVDLAFNNMLQFPNNFLSNCSRLLRLNLKKNFLDDSFWSKLTNIKNILYLDVSSNLLTVINQTIISELPKLGYLFLEYNRIAVIPDRTFQNQRLLFELNLAGNQIDTIEKDTFSGLLNLKILHLESNRIFSINQDAFKPLTDLHDVNISTNFLYKLPVLSRQNLLTVLDVSDNRLSTLQEDTFIGQKRLQVLDLSKNNIRVIPDSLLIPCESLEYLDMSNNAIEYVHPSMFMKLNLKTVHLQWNRIQNIGKTFVTLKNLQELNLSHNEISDTILSNTFPESLEMLDLSNNYIEHIRPSAFIGLKQIRMVNIRFNRIETISKEALQVSTGRYSQTGFMIDENPLKCDCNLLWLKKWDQSTRGPIIVNLNETRCNGAYDFPETSVRSIPEDRFLCSYKTMCGPDCVCCNFDSCYCKYVCPEQCECYHSADFNSVHPVKCSNKNLSTIETNSPTIATTFDLSGNSFVTILSHRFIVMKHLSKLFLNNSRIEMLQNLSFGGLSNLKELYLDHNLLQMLEIGMFDGLSSLRSLYLDYNRISVIKSGVFDSLGALKTLSLSNNQLHRVNDYTTHLLYSVKDLSLFLNPWRCSCTMFFASKKNNLAFVNISKLQLGESPVIYCIVVIKRGVDKHVLLEDFGHVCGQDSVGDLRATKSNLTFLENDIKNRDDYDYNPNVSKTELDEPFLESKFKIFVSAIVISTVIVIFIITTVCRKEFQRCWLFTKYKCAADNEVVFYDKTRHNDAFVTYHPSDEAYVIRDLVLRLERGKRRYNLLVHYRDCPAGGSIQHFIENGVKSSHRTIIVLSKESTENDMSLTYVTQCVKEDSLKRLILVTIGKIDKNNINPILRDYMKSEYCINYSDSLFWDKLYLCLPEPGSVARDNARAEAHPYACTDIARLSHAVRDNQAYEEPLSMSSRQLPTVTGYVPPSITYTYTGGSENSSNIYEEIKEQDYGESRRYEEPWKDMDLPSCIPTFATQTI